jgi:hypothetical protein
MGQAYGSHEGNKEHLVGNFHRESVLIRKRQVGR